jgi:hypothetical protein
MPNQPLQKKFARPANNINAKPTTTKKMARPANYISAE